DYAATYAATYAANAAANAARAANADYAATYAATYAANAANADYAATYAANAAATALVGFLSSLLDYHAELTGHVARDVTDEELRALAKAVNLCPSAHPSDRRDLCHPDRNHNSRPTTPGEDQS